MGPIGCGNNPISNQGGNWAPDRAGWCPGMVVPLRLDKFDNVGVPAGPVKFVQELLEDEQILELAQQSLQAPGGQSLLGSPLNVIEITNRIDE